MKPAKVTERGFPAFLPVPVQEKTFHAFSPVNGSVKRGTGTLIRESFCILPCPERRGNRVGIVPRHLPGSVKNKPELTQPLMYGSPGLTDVHQEIFSHRPDTIEAGLPGDIPECVSFCREGNPRGPGKRTPVWI